MGFNSSARVDVLWTDQFGTAAGDVAWGTATDGVDAYVVGYQNDGFDAFLRKVSSDGLTSWSNVIDSGGIEQASAVAAGEGHVYVVGYVTGTFPGQTNGGDCSSDARCTDAFVSKYSSAGAEIWTRQFGSPEAEQGLAVAVDATGVYTGGDTNGILPGVSGAAPFDAFVRKYSHDGDVLWTRQFGGPSFDRVLGLTSDGSAVYAVGLTGNPPPDPADCCDAFIRKLTVDGDDIWARQFGTTGQDGATGVALDASGVYVGGVTNDAPPGLNRLRGEHGAFVRKFSHTGDNLWLDQFGTPRFDAVSAVSAGALGIYVSGTTCHVLPGQGRNFEGGCDAFVRSYSPLGSVHWTVQLGTEGFDAANGVAAGASFVYVVGGTDGAFPGENNAGGTDAFVAKLEC